jgi:hypothetical protein
VELLFRELKSQYALGSFETGKEEIVRIQVLAALLTLVVSRAILRALCDRAAEAEDSRIILTERWAATFRSAAQLLLLELAGFYGYPPPDLGEFLYQEAIQPASRDCLVIDVNNGLSGGSPA